MAYSKNKNPKTRKTSSSRKIHFDPPRTHKPINTKKTKSARMHKSKVSIRMSKLAKSRAFSRKSYLAAKKTTLVIIASAMIVVVVALFFGTLNTPERTTTAAIDEIARDYYENYFYPSILEANELDTPSEGDLEPIMGDFLERGFASVELEQLFIYDNQKWAGAKREIVRYCNPMATSVRYYPDVPFGKKDYHFVVSYECDYE